MTDFNEERAYLAGLTESEGYLGQCGSGDQNAAEEIGEEKIRGWCRLGVWLGLLIASWAVCLGVALAVVRAAQRLAVLAYPLVYRFLR